MKAALVVLFCALTAYAAIVTAMSCSQVIMARDAVVMGTAR